MFNLRGNLDKRPMGAKEEAKDDLKNNNKDLKLNREIKEKQKLKLIKKSKTKR